MDQSQQDAVELAKQLDPIIASFRNGLLMTRKDYNQTYQAVLTGISHIYANYLATASLECDGTEARADKPEVVQRERERRVIIGMQVVSKVFEDFKRQIYAHMN
jgi:hypothetical protein